VRIGAHAQHLGIDELERRLRPLQRLREQPCRSRCGHRASDAQDEPRRPTCETARAGDWVLPHATTLSCGDPGRHFRTS
jgi:hypothetical protein